MKFILWVLLATILSASLYYAVLRRDPELREVGTSPSTSAPHKVDYDPVNSPTKGSSQQTAHDLVDQTLDLSSAPRLSLATGLELARRDFAQLASLRGLDSDEAKSEVFLRALSLPYPDSLEFIFELLSMVHEEDAVGLSCASVALSKIWREDDRRFDGLDFFDSRDATTARAILGSLLLAQSSGDVESDDLFATLLGETLRSQYYSSATKRIAIEVVHHIGHVRGAAENESLDFLEQEYAGYPGPVLHSYDRLLLRDTTAGEHNLARVLSTSQRSRIIGQLARIALAPNSGDVQRSRAITALAKHDPLHLNRVLNDATPSQKEQIERFLKQ